MENTGKGLVVNIDGMDPHVVKAFQRAWNESQMEGTLIFKDPEAITWNLLDDGRGYGSIHVGDGSDLIVITSPIYNTEAEAREFIDQRLTDLEYQKGARRLNIEAADL